MRELRMKLEYQSRNLLASTKSAAKLIEFQVPAEFHYSNSGPLQDLLILSIGILGQLSGLELKTGISQNFAIDSEVEGLKRQLIHVAQYFDALDTTGIESQISSYLIMLGSAAYYLAEMPGSASVLAKKLSSDQQYGLTESSIEGPLVYLLIGNYAQRNYVRCQYSFVNNLINAFGDFLDQLVDAESVVDYCHIVRQEIYEVGTD
jgi:POLQ-like helicase